ncbi:MAG: adenosylcobinamide-phosphate synthase CbiB [Lachnospiraceae bacterium]
MYTAVSIIIGVCLDFIIGDPYQMPHPIRAIGNLIAVLEKKLNDGLKNPKQLLSRGLFMVVIVLLLSTVIPFLILVLAYQLHPVVGVLVQSVMTYQLIATKCLRDESTKVQRALETGDLDASRKAVSMIVGRDTASLSAEGVAKAAVETVAENTADGVIAPLFYVAIGGPVLGFFYKAVNTMDSMVGYKNEKFLYFGRIAAKLDDVMNYIPARLSAVLMIISSAILGMDYKQAISVFKSDRYNHKSPNSAQTESVCAGALGLTLAGDAYYFGELVKKPSIGYGKKKTEPNDIARANKLLYMTAILMTMLCVGIRCL